MLSESQLRQIMPNAGDIRIWAQKLEWACQKFDIDTRLRRAAFIANLAHESGELRNLEENLRYSPKRLTEVWPSRFKTIAAATPYAFNPEKLANKVYANRMGNADEAGGDGYKFRGRGPIGLTGKDNYRRCGEGIGYDLLTYPQLLMQIGVGSLSAAWFWHDKDLNPLADAGDFTGIVRKINGGVIGLADRTKYYRKALTVFRI